MQWEQERLRKIHWKLYIFSSDSQITRHDLNVLTWFVTSNATKHKLGEKINSNNYLQILLDPGLLGYRQRLTRGRGRGGLGGLLTVRQHDPSALHDLAGRGKCGTLNREKAAACTQVIPGFSLLEQQEQINLDVRVCYQQRQGQEEQTLKWSG